MIWKKKQPELEYSVEKFYAEEKRLNELEFVFFETPRQIAECWVYALASKVDESIYENMLHTEIKKNKRIMSMKFEPENYCIFLEINDGSKAEICAGVVMDGEEWAYLPRISV